MPAQVLFDVLQLTGEWKRAERTLSCQKVYQVLLTAEMLNLWNYNRGRGGSFSEHIFTVKS